ncbi:MAG: type II toxin-antitoxin system VapC family toxin [Chloroflexi bacterium]|nr:type II toxin-antitoxin system VapC family toxin [Chloroflexota bacterium]
MEVPRFVIDASVAIKWYLSDEQHIETARQVRLDFEQGLVRLFAPAQLHHEVASAVLKATRNTGRPKRLSPAEGQQIVEDFLGWDVELIDHGILIPSAYRIAGRYGCSYYDGLFLATAEMTNSPFVFADGKLRRALGNRFPLAMWIEDYQHA